MSPAKLSFIVHVVAVGAIGVAAATVSAMGMNLPGVEPTYELVMTYKSDRFVIDHDLSITDCVDELPRSDPYKSVSFACKLED